MTLNQLRYFCVLARTEHYGAAARLLYIAQPSLSRAIALLQEELGTPLFEKHGRNVMLTQAGREFLPYAQRALEQIELGAAAVQPYVKRETRISIGCVIPSATTYVAPMMADFLRSTGISAQFDIQTDQSEVLVEGLRQRRYDLVFGSYVPGTEGVEFVPVAEMPFVVIVRRDDPLAVLEAITPEQLRAAARPILLTNAKAYAALIRQMLACYGITALVDGAANEDNGLLGMVQAGLGIFIGTDYPQMHSDDVALVPLKQDRFRRYIYMAYSAARTYSPAVQELIRFNCGRRLAEEGEQAKPPKARVG